MLRVVLDTNILVAALRSPKGASSTLLKRLAQGRFVLLCSVPLFLEYEAVLSRPGQLAAFGLTPAQVDVILDYLANVAQEVRMHYLWRPQLNDVADEMVLDTTINGHADVLVTFNVRHFSPAPNFSIEVLQPGDALRRVS